MILKQRIGAFVKMGLFIKQHADGSYNSEPQLHQGLDEIIQAAYIHNGWFNPNFVKLAIENIGTMLNIADIERLVANREVKVSKTVAVICAGNIPMVGFHDIMCVLLSGNKALIKFSSDDNILLPFFLKLLVHYEPAFESYISFAGNKLSNFDAVIATGSNNTATHFNYYFGKYPNIIRKNRTSVAVLKGTESKEDLKQLGNDIFLYYGLGCRNVSKLLVPQDYTFDAFFESILDFSFVIENKKYNNNYEYHRAIYLLEGHKFLDNNFLMVKESHDLHSPVGVLFFERYNTAEDYKKYIQNHKDQIQCIVGQDYTPFGYSQRPVITDFADNVNTFDFLVTL